MDWIQQVKPKRGDRVDYLVVGKIWSRETSEAAKRTVRDFENNPGKLQRNLLMLDPSTQ